MAALPYYKSHSNNALQENSIHSNRDKFQNTSNENPSNTIGKWTPKNV